MRARPLLLSLVLIGLSSQAFAWAVASDPENDGNRITAWDDDSDNRGFQLALTCNDAAPAGAELYFYTGAPWNAVLSSHTSEALKLEIDGKEYPYKAGFVQAGDEAALMASVAADPSVPELFTALGKATSSITLTYGGVVFSFDVDDVEASVGTFLDTCVVVPGKA